MAVPGGVAAVSNSDEQFFFLPSPSVFFRSQWLPILGSVLVLFRFPSSWFVSVLLSLFGSLFLSFSLRVFRPFFTPPLFGFFFFIYRGSTGGGTMVSAPSITHGWSVLSVVVVEARRERDAGVFFQNFFAFCSAKTGGEGGR